MVVTLKKNKICGNERMLILLLQLAQHQELSFVPTCGLQSKINFRTGFTDLINYGYMMKLQVPNRWSGSVDYMEHLIAQE